MAARKLRDLQREAENLTLPIGRDVRLETWLQRWLADHIDHRVAIGDLRASTAAMYRQHVRDHIVPHIGAVRLTKLRPTHIRQLHTTLLAKDLSPSTVARVHSSLRKALTDAEREELVLTNVAKKVPAPRSQPREPTPLTLEQAQRLLVHEPDHPWHVAFALCVKLG